MVEKLIADTASLLKNLQLYSIKPTKALAKKIRMSLGELKNKVPSLRAHLVELDKKGY